MIYTAQTLILHCGSLRKKSSLQTKVGGGVGPRLLDLELRGGVIALGIDAIALWISSIERPPLSDASARSTTLLIDSAEFFRECPARGVELPVPPIRGSEGSRR
mmetsp:Transcript_38558/g.57311  ORF Transcript_38558/g.57311 Transcript_38558/m.57311 type:complete len:104 (+) Transcript_38558:126-437(+)